MQHNSYSVYGIAAALLVINSVQPAAAQVNINVNAAADTAESAALRGGGQYLQGLAWYNLNSAKAAAINADMELQLVQAMNRFQAEKRAHDAKKIEGNKQKAEELRLRRKQREMQLRTEPTPDDVRKGDALNVLLYDLMDPRITLAQWQAHLVPLPEGMSIKDLNFRFVSSSGGESSPVPGVISLARLNIARNWPIVLSFDELKNEKSACEVAFANVRHQVLESELKLDRIRELDKTLDALEAKVATAVPTERQYRSQATLFVKDLRNATRMFDARTVDYAKEMLIDTEEHDATTVAELVAFSLKYRLQFASAERTPTAEALYPRLYEAMTNQMKALGIKSVDEVEELSVESIVKRYADDCQVARKRILASFDKQIDAAKKSSAPKPSEKQSRIAMLNAEKKNCTKNGSMPFSPAMRGDAIVYLDELKDAQKSALEAMEKLSHEDFLSGQKRIVPVRVGKWDRVDEKGNKGGRPITLNADGTTTERRHVTWTLDKSIMTILWHESGEVESDNWINTYTIEDNGLRCAGKNQFGDGESLVKID